MLHIGPWACDNQILNFVKGSLDKQIRSKNKLCTFAKTLQRIVDEAAIYRVWFPIGSGLETRVTNYILSSVVRSHSEIKYF